MLSAGTAVASSRKPLCGVFGHVLFPQDKKCYDSFCIARRKLVCIFEESPPSLTRTGKVIYERILCHFIQLMNCIGKCYTSSPYTRRLLREQIFSVGRVSAVPKASMRPHSAKHEEAH